MTSPSIAGPPSSVPGFTEPQLSSIYQYIQGRLPQAAKTVPLLVTSLPATGADGQQVVLTDSLTAPTSYLLYQWNAAAAAWVLVGTRVITGTVNADGTIADGTGFSLSTHSTTGQYDITFGTAFSSVANVQVTGVGTTFHSQSWTVSAPATGGVSVFGQTGGIGPVDQGFSFVAQPTF